MSLGKLLATGRSLVSGPGLGRYNISSRNRLPTFGGGNPFANPAPASRPVEASVAAAGLAVRITSEAEPVSALQPGMTVGGEFKKTQRIPELASVRARTDWILKFTLVVDRMGTSVSQVGVRVLVQFRKAAGVVMSRIRRSEPRTVIPRLGKPSVQTELSLDNVTVVRNDLEESDLEIVTAETATSTQVAPQVASGPPRRGPEPPALKKLTSLLLGAKTP